MRTELKTRIGIIPKIKKIKKYLSTKLILNIQHKYNDFSSFSFFFFSFADNIGVGKSNVLAIMRIK